MKKTNISPLEMARKYANKYAKKKVDTVNDEIQAICMTDKGLVGNDDLKLAIGRALALAYACGFLEQRN